jgi:5-methylcytosine-specific restriction endonuclease McrA
VTATAEHRRRNRGSEQGRAENRERMRRRRARLRACGDSAQARLRAALDHLGWGVCLACATVHAAGALEVDHTVPVAAGGCDSPDNVQPLCGPCHLVKTVEERACR